MTISTLTVWYTVDVLFTAHVLTVSISLILRGWICAEWVLRAAAFDSECAHRIVLLCATQSAECDCLHVPHYIIIYWYLRMCLKHTMTSCKQQAHEHKQTMRRRTGRHVGLMSVLWSAQCRGQRQLGLGHNLYLRGSCDPHTIAGLVLHVCLLLSALCAVGRGEHDLHSSFLVIF